MAAEGLKTRTTDRAQTAHKYHPETLKELKSRMDELAAKGRDPVPKEVRLTTYTLQYPRAAWVEIEGLTHHWERARRSRNRRPKRFWNHHHDKRRFTDAWSLD